MNIFVTLCIEDVEEDADYQGIGNHVLETVRTAYPFHTVSVEEVETT